jgi:hypothetical protein
MPKTVEIEIPAYGDGIQGTASLSLSKDCWNCKNLNVERPFFCKAFPEGIPKEILSGRIGHREPFEGDKGIQFAEDEY